jgi:hypothetical protein
MSEALGVDFEINCPTSVASYFLAAESLLVKTTTKALGRVVLSTSVSLVIIRE